MSGKKGIEQTAPMSVSGVKRILREIERCLGGEEKLEYVEIDRNEDDRDGSEKLDVKIVTTRSDGREEVTNVEHILNERGEQ